MQAYTSQMVAITMMALALSEDSIARRSKRDAIIDGLGRLPDTIREVRAGRAQPCWLTWLWTGQSAADGMPSGDVWQLQPAFGLHAASCVQLRPSPSAHGLLYALPAGPCMLRCALLERASQLICCMHWLASRLLGQAESPQA